MQKHVYVLYTQIYYTVLANIIILVALTSSFCLPSGLSAHTHVELPYYSKFLLIAAYLASYNPARTDRRFFLKVGPFLIFFFFLCK